MKVLILGPPESSLTSIIRDSGSRTVERSERIDPDYVKTEGIQFAVSYRYRHIIKPDVLSILPERVINLHISYLPWNRGADPNLWSFLEETPKGVTIHYVDQGIDTGDIIVQKRICFPSPSETLASTYEKLNEEIVELFRRHWPDIATGKCPRKKQPPGGSCHRSEDKQKYMHLLTDGWGTPVAKIRGMAKSEQMQ